MSDDRNLIDKLKDKAMSTIDGLKNQYGLGQAGLPWPQTTYSPITGSGGLSLYPAHKTKGFLPPINITPLSAEGDIKFGEYVYKDWRGHQLSLSSIGTSDTKDKFERSPSLPKSDNELVDNPYSTRDLYTIFGDNATDYFRHGLQVIDGLTPIENPENGRSTLRLDSFTGTPFEKNDPVIFGFDIIIDDVSSPLLNGAVDDFLRNYSNISEVAARIPVYEDFKQQFVKFFKTKATVGINPTQTTMSKMRDTAGPETNNNDDIFSDRNTKAYMNYYLKKISGLDKLIEQNTPSSKKFLTEYNKEVIQLSFSEDLTLSIGTLAHLYKLLYWSKPNGKGIVPENLLRFNCDIIVSEVRNYKRVIRAIDGNDIKVIKDNVSRYVYSLKECQFYFNSMPHNSEIDMGSISPFAEGSYNIQFDYKYSSSKLERFVPSSTGGEYVGYDAGAMWRIGAIGARDGAGGSISSPTFYTKGQNSLNDNGVDNNFVVNIPNDGLYKRTFDMTSENTEKLSTMEMIKKNAKTKAKELKNRLEDTAIKSASRELQYFVNTRTALLNKSLNKILSANNVKSIRPPRNIYTEGDLNAGGRIFFDIRGELLNFAGDALGGILGGNRNRSF